MAVTEWYCGTGGTDTTGGGAGTTHALRWATIQYALNSGATGFDNTQSNRLNIYQSQTLTASVDVQTTYGNPGTYPLIFQGYGSGTPAAGDGTPAAINCGGFRWTNTTTSDNLHWRHLKFSNWGSAECINADNDCSVTECEFDGEGARTECIDLDNSALIASNKCYDINCGVRAIQALLQSIICDNYFYSSSVQTGSIILYLGTGNFCFGNVLSIDSVADFNAIQFGSNTNIIINRNTIWNESASVGNGINITGTGKQRTVITNNIIGGFNGTGGTGIKAIAGSILSHVGYNRFYQNSTHQDIAGDVMFDLGNNDVLAGNPFTSTGNADHNDDDFTLKDTYLAGSYPAYPTELYDPDDTQAGRNQNMQDVGALQSTPPGIVGSGGRAYLKRPLQLNVASGETGSMDSDSDFFAFRLVMKDATPIAKVEVKMSGISGSPGDLNCVMVADVNGAPDTHTNDIGGGSPTLVTRTLAQITASAINEITFTNPYTPSAGEYVWVVLYPESGGTFDASNKYAISLGFKTYVAAGENRASTSTNSGTTWSENVSRLTAISVLDASGNYLEQPGSCCYVSSVSMIWNDVDDTPDERGMAFTLGAGLACKVEEVDAMYWIQNSTSDFEIAVYRDTTLVGSRRTVDVSTLDDQFSTNREITLSTNNVSDILGTATVRTTLRPSNGGDLKIGWTDLGTQARRESCLALRDVWYCSRDGGTGEFDDHGKSQLLGIFPAVEFVGTEVVTEGTGSGGTSKSRIFGGI